MTRSERGPAIPRKALGMEIGPYRTQLAGLSAALATGTPAKSW